MPTDPTPRAAASDPAPTPVGPVAPGSPEARRHPARVANPTKPKAAAKKAAPATAGTFTVESFLNALRAQESGANYGAKSSSSSASGAYQYLDSTWNNFGGYKHAWQAPKAVQDARARADVTAALKRYDGDWEKVAAAHFAGAGWVAAHPDKATWGVNPVPGSANPTVSGYVSSLFGRSGAKVTATGVAGDPESGTNFTPTTTQQVKDVAAAQYGYLAGFLDDPEIGPIIQQAAKEGWDSDRLQGALYNTKFWQNHAAVTRQFDANTKLDPATQKQQIEQQIIDIQTQAKRSGISLGHADLAQLAWTSLRYGWTGQQLTNAIVAQGKMDTSGKNPGAASATAAQLRQQAAQYMVPVSDQQINKWVADIETGNLAVGDFDGYLKEQAKSLFPGLAGAIDRGVTVEQYADPYRQAAAQTLEVDPQSIDFMHDPKFKPALFQIDPKTKERTSMGLADWDTYLRKLPQYAQTSQANQQAAAFGNSLLQTFGEVAQ